MYRDEIVLIVIAPVATFALCIDDVCFGCVAGVPPGGKPTSTSGDIDTAAAVPRPSLRYGEPASALVILTPHQQQQQQRLVLLPCVTIECTYRYQVTYILSPPTPPLQRTKLTFCVFLSTPADNNRRSHDWPGLKKRQETIQEVPPRHATRFPQGTSSGGRGGGHYWWPFGVRGVGCGASFREVMEKNGS